MKERAISDWMSPGNVNSYYAQVERDASIKAPRLESQRVVPEAWTGIVGRRLRVNGLFFAQLFY